MGMDPLCNSVSLVVMKCLRVLGLETRLSPAPRFPMDRGTDPVSVVPLEEREQRPCVRACGLETGRQVRAGGAGRGHPGLAGDRP